jgi:lysyl-tRNA synthetase class 2
LRNVNETMSASWRPSAGLATLRARSTIYRRLRDFFERRDVLEVETPILSQAATVERQIDSFRTTDGRWLATSPEFAMKRLLAAGSGPIFQLSHVFRAEEQGALHNPEFTMLEWYRPGWGLAALMDEVEALLRELAQEQAGGQAALAAPFERIGYQALLMRELKLDPFSAPLVEIREAITSHEVPLPDNIGPEDRDDRDFWLDLAVGAVVGPTVGNDTPVFVHDYPPSQAALARVRAGDPPVAERFELYWRGVELANGFHELADAGEQRRRFEADRQWRQSRQRTVPPYDDNLIAALEAGLPDCSGVALGVDRLVMLLLDLPNVAAAMAFDASRA